MAPPAEASLLRRTLLAVGFAVGGTAVFTSACLLVASLALDQALPNDHANVAPDPSAEVAEQSPTDSARTATEPHRS